MSIIIVITIVITASVIPLAPQTSSPQSNPAPPQAMHDVWFVRFYALV